MSILSLFFGLSVSWAIENVVTLHLDQPTITKGYTVVTPDENLKIAIWPKSINQEIDLVLKPRQFATVDLPEMKSLISGLYEFEIKGENLAINEPFTLQLSYGSDTSAYKAIYFYNYSTKVWSKVEPSIIFQEEQFIRTTLKIPYALFAVLEEKVLYGQASWYKYQGCNCTASPDYLKGTILKVTNLFNDKSVIVTVNDYGPDREVHPDRVVDLDLTAFKQIADKQLGVVEVKVEKVSQ